MNCELQGVADPSLERLVPGPYYEWWDAVETQKPPGQARRDAATAAAAETTASTTTVVTEVQYDGLAESLALVAETIRTQVWRATRACAACRRAGCAYAAMHSRAVHTLQI